MKVRGAVAQILIRRLLVGLVILIAVAHARADRRCEALFRESPSPVIDERYGSASQYDPELIEMGLVARRESHLCGPTCVYNVLEKFRLMAGEKSAFESDASGIASITETFLKIGVPKQSFAFERPDAPQEFTVAPQTLEEVAAQKRGFRPYGAGMRFMKAAWERLIEDRNLDLSLETRSPVSGKGPEVSMADLRSSTASSAAAIVHITRYETPTLRKVHQENRDSSHYVVVTGFDPTNARRFYFRDPLRPTILRSALLTKVKPLRFAQPTYRLRFEDRFERQPTILITGLVLIHRK